MDAQNDQHTQILQQSVRIASIEWVHWRIAEQAHIYYTLEYAKIS